MAAVVQNENVDSLFTQRGTALAAAPVKAATGSLSAKRGETDADAIAITEHGARSIGRAVIVELGETAETAPGNTNCLITAAEPDCITAIALGLLIVGLINLGCTAVADKTSATAVGSLRNRSIKEAIVFADAGTAARNTYLAAALDDPDTIADMMVCVIGLDTATQVAAHFAIGPALHTSRTEITVVIKPDAPPGTRATRLAEAFDAAEMPAAMSTRCTIRSLMVADVIAAPMAFCRATRRAVIAEPDASAPLAVGKTGIRALNATPCAMYFPVGDCVPVTAHALPVAETFWLSYRLPVLRSSVQPLPAAVDVCAQTIAPNSISFALVVENTPLLIAVAFVVATKDTPDPSRDPDVARPLYSINAKSISVKDPLKLTVRKFPVAAAIFEQE